MSAAAEGSGQTTKAIVSDSASSAALKEPQKPATALEEDDEFEDFPVEGEVSLKLQENAFFFVIPWGSLVS